MWTFLDNHALVLPCAARDPDVRLRDIAGQVGITERAAQRLIGELVEGGYLTRVRSGRRNVYQIAAHAPLRHALERHRTAGELLTLLDGTYDPVGAAADPPPGIQPCQASRSDGSFRKMLS